MTTNNLREYVHQMYLENKDVKSSVSEFKIFLNSDAIELLKERDPSLAWAIELAIKNNISIENLNSRILATLIAQNYMLNYADEFLNDND
ncbi:MAG: hypothetical protein ABFD07_12235 [Methanobacterium sp.]